MSYNSISAGEVKLTGAGGTEIQAYYARPDGPGPHPSVVVVHHLPGWDEWTCEVVRKIAHNGFAAVAPNLYSRADGALPSEQTAHYRPNLGPPDTQAVGDIDGAAAFLKAQDGNNGKVGIIGFCSGGRHAYLAAAQLNTFDAVVDCWGGGVVPNDRFNAGNETRPIAPIELTKDIKIPMLGIFGNDDSSPSPEVVDQTEEELKKHGVEYEFHRYDGAGHAFFTSYVGMYRPLQTADGWQKVWDFFDRKLGKPVNASIRETPMMAPETPPAFSSSGAR